MSARNLPLTIMYMDCDSAVRQATTTMRTAGYLVVKSFDLHSAVPTQCGCNCNPCSCSCQMVVLMIYAQEGPPVTLIFDSDGSQTNVNLVNNPQQSAHPGWFASLTQLLAPTFSADAQMTSSIFEIRK